MGVVGIALRGFGKALKKGKKIIKRDAPFYGVAGAAGVGHHLSKKIKGEPTLVDVGKKIIKKYKKNGNPN